MKRNVNDGFPQIVSQYQSGVHKMVEVPDDGGEVIIPSPEGNIRIYSSRWFRIRIVEVRVEGISGLFYSPIVEYRAEDAGNPPRIVPDNIAFGRQLCLPGKEVCHQEECPVCLEELNEDVAVVLPCGHKFCKACVDRWASECREGTKFNTDNVVYGRAVHIEDQAAPKNPECPLCRSPFTM